MKISERRPNDGYPKGIVGGKREKSPITLVKTRDGKTIMVPKQALKVQREQKQEATRRNANRAKAHAKRKAERHRKRLERRRGR